MKPKATLLPCGHFSQGTDADGTPNCSICGERAAIARMKERAAGAAVTDPTRGQPATARDTGAAAGWPMGESEPREGVYNLPDSIYHRDPLKVYGTESLSGSSARHLIPPSTPAHYRWRMDHPSQPTPAMIFGSAVHALALDTQDLAAFDGNSWSSKAGDLFLAEHDPDGDEAPILAKDVSAAKAMAHSLLAHPLVQMGLSNGSPEQAMFCRDPETGVWLRGKVDYLARGVGSHLIVTDIKTTECAHESEFARSAGKLSYHIQDAHYARIIKHLGLARKVTMIFAAVEKTPPYLVNVHQISGDDMKRGDELNEMAIRRFAHCLNTGEWPGYPQRINKLTLPAYVARAEEEALYEGDEDQC